jgi:hypothetical protein
MSGQPASKPRDIFPHCGCRQRAAA